MHTHLPLQLMRKRIDHPSHIVTRGPATSDIRIAHLSKIICSVTNNKVYADIFLLSILKMFPYCIKFSSDKLQILHIIINVYDILTKLFHFIGKKYRKVTKKYV